MLPESLMLTPKCTQTCVIRNCPVGLGEPVFDKLEADLAHAMVSHSKAQFQCFVPLSMIHGLLELGKRIVLKQLLENRNADFYFSSAFPRPKALNLALVSSSKSFLPLDVPELGP